MNFVEALDSFALDKADFGKLRPDKVERGKTGLALPDKREPARFHRLVVFAVQKAIAGVQRAAQIAYWALDRFAPDNFAPDSFALGNFAFE